MISFLIYIDVGSSSGSSSVTLSEPSPSLCVSLLLARSHSYMIVYGKKLFAAAAV